jgi:hypothetical protein
MQSVFVGIAAIASAGATIWLCVSIIRLIVPSWRKNAGRHLLLSLVILFAAPIPLFGTGQPDQAKQHQNSTQPSAPGIQLWVSVDVVNRRTCPSTNCGIVGRQFYREGVKLFEDRNGWARVTDYYDAACEAGLSAYVDSGNAACIPANGIVESQFAEWIFMQALVSERPPDPSEGATGTSHLVAQSDDFRHYESAFVAAADSLMQTGTCHATDFEEFGGWVKSMSHRDDPVYFTYCGGMTTAHRLYLNAETGAIFR